MNPSADWIKPCWKMRVMLTGDKPDPTKPIIFKAPGLGASDVRFKIFGREIHAHSILLKLHTGYFRTFLDSPDKSPLPASEPFRYEYVSVVDPDATWSLPTAATAGQTLEDGRLADEETKLGDGDAEDGDSNEDTGNPAKR